MEVLWLLAVPLALPCTHRNSHQLVCLRGWSRSGQAAPYTCNTKVLEAIFRALEVAPAVAQVWAVRRIPLAGLAVARNLRQSLRWFEAVPGGTGKGQGKS